jgi:putative ABC transport system substrate-binding protein
MKIGDSTRPGRLTVYSGDWRHAASYVDRIPRGEKPVDLPVEQATQLKINLRTTRALGIIMPAALLARADAVIE